MQNVLKLNLKCSFEKLSTISKCDKLAVVWASASTYFCHISLSLSNFILNGETRRQVEKGLDKIAVFSNRNNKSGI